MRYRTMLKVYMPVNGNVQSNVISVRLNSRAREFDSV